jgi:hypothetical protein
MEATMVPRNLYGWLTIVVTAALAVGGILLGVVATAVPNPLRGGVSHSIRVAVDRPEASIDFSWKMSPDGAVTMLAGILGDTPEEVVVSIVLRCDSRLSAVESSRAAEVSESGRAQECEDPSLFNTNIATQVIGVLVRQDELVIVEGRPSKPWTSSGAGQRVARTPQIFFGLQSTEIVEAFAMVEPGAQSTLDVALEATPSETLSIYVPGDASGTAVSTSASILDLGDGFEPSVSGSVVWSAVGAGSGLQASFARWDDSAATSTAQLQLLLSGVFLGVAASLLVEALFAKAQFRRAIESSQPDRKHSEGDASSPRRNGAQQHDSD